MSRRKGAAAASLDVPDDLFVYEEGGLEATRARDALRLTEQRATASKMDHAPLSGGGRRWTRKSRRLIAVVQAIFEEFDGSMSTRQTFYQLVSRGAVPNSKPGERRVQRLLVHMREEELVEWGRVVDRTRSKHHRPGWDGVADLMESVREQYRRNRWRDQETVVMICCEKQALEGIFAEVVDEYGASLWVIRGFNSWSFAYEWACEIKELTKRTPMAMAGQIKELTEQGKHVVISYFGDHDPSGLALERDCQEKLTYFGAEFEWHREALHFDDLKVFDMVNVPTKKRDSRTKAYVAEFGDRAAELDALPPDELRRRIRSAIDEHIDMDAWDRHEDMEAADKESIDNFTRTIGQILDNPVEPTTP
jgi:hypothetical protein